MDREVRAAQATEDVVGNCVRESNTRWVAH